MTGKAGTTYELYAVFDEDEGLYYETLSDTPAEAVQSIDNSRDLHARELRMCLGKASVRCVRVLVMEPAVDDDRAAVEA